MKEKMIKISFLEKGDRVLTPSGTATVAEDEEVYEERMDKYYPVVFIVLDEPISGYPVKGKKIEIDRGACSII